MGLGPLVDVSLADARAMAAEHRQTPVVAAIHSTPVEDDEKKNARLAPNNAPLRIALRTTSNPIR